MKVLNTLTQKVTQVYRARLYKLRRLAATGKVKGNEFPSVLMCQLYERNVHVTYFKLQWFTHT